MSLQHYQVALQAVSSFAIAGGFIFTAIQFRAYRRAQHVANFAKMVEMQAHLREMRVHDPKLAEVYRHDVAHASSEREVREYFFNLMQLSVFEIVWFSWKHGQIPEDYFRSWEDRMRDIAAEPSFRTMMGTRSMKIMHDDFDSYMRRLLASVPERVHESPPPSLAAAVPAPVKP